MSLLVTWHTFAMVVAPSPDSDITDAARSILDPYLTLFRLDNGWGFFAPDVGSGSQFRYVIEDAAGNRREKRLAVLLGQAQDRNLVQEHCRRGSPFAVADRAPLRALMERELARLRARAERLLAAEPEAARPAA